jgi:hypothetical protein
VEEVELHRVHELPVIRQIFLPLDELVEPAEGLAVTICNVSLFFIFPMSGNAVLGDTMHLLRADLEFDMLPLRAHHRRMQRLIKIGLWNRDVVFEAPRHRPPD